MDLKFLIAVCNLFRKNIGVWLLHNERNVYCAAEFQTKMACYRPYFNFRLMYLLQFRLLFLRATQSKVP